MADAKDSSSTTPPVNAPLQDELVVTHRRLTLGKPHARLHHACGMEENPDRL